MRLAPLSTLSNLPTQSAHWSFAADDACALVGQAHSLPFGYSGRRDIVTLRYNEAFRTPVKEAVERHRSARRKKELMPRALLISTILAGSFCVEAAFAQTCQLPLPPGPGQPDATFNALVTQNGPGWTGGDGT